MKNKKGFTLIELLAVIVILAIIALIAVPIVLSIINDTKESALSRSIELYVNAVEQGIMVSQFENILKPGIYTSSEDGKTLTHITDTTKTINVDYKGKVKCATIYINSAGIVYLSSCKVNDVESDYAYAAAKGVYKATPENVSEVILSAKAGSIVELEAGNYSTIVLSGQTAYPENLTILGSEDAVIDGISITSGVTDERSMGKGPTTAAMPNGLSLVNLNLTKSISLKNAAIKNFSIMGCNLQGGAVININSNTFKDEFGTDFGTNGIQTNNRFYDDTVRVSNLVIVDNTIERGGYDENADARTAIYVKSADGIKIEGNTINSAYFNGIQVTGANLEKDSTKRGTSTIGSIVINNNTISNTADRAIRIADIEEITQLTISNNKIYNLPKIDIEGEGAMKINVKNADKEKVSITGNTYGGNPISTSDKIILEIE